MASPVVGTTVWQFVANFLRGGSRIMVTQLLQDRTGTDFTDYAASALAFMNKQLASGSVLLQMINSMSNSYTLDKLTMQPIYPTRKRMIELDDVGSTSGALTGTPLPPNSAATLEKQSEDATRWGYGVSHLPVGDSTKQNTNGSWSSLFLTDLSNLATNWIGDWLSTETSHIFRPILWSKKTPTRITPIISSAIGTAIRVMIRRTLGRGI